MLSQPMPRVSLGSAARQASTSSAATSLMDMLAVSRLRIKSTACWLDMTSHTPSHASSRNSSSAQIVSHMTSGCAVMIWSLGARSALPLYLRSPIARDRLRLPLTRHTPPMSLRKPPAASMRFFSISCAGLWSFDSGTADPPRHSTARLSPALPTKIFPSRIIATTAVQPAWILCSGSSQSSSASMSPAPLPAAADPGAGRACVAAASEGPPASVAPASPPFSLFIILFSISIFFSTSSASFLPTGPSSPSASISALLRHRKL
mmetsp:Transcript_5580/g.14188  ORF Transcript_5580/g.14188 Transcript_5580/m.14188 type:complete len:263 (+) Transcript_5580:151-939(+)